jgi:hypothetical protein
VKRFLRKTILYLVSFGLVIATIPIYILWSTPKLSELDFDGGLLLKKERLRQNKNRKKIVFIGGSNLAMGLNSSLIQDSLGMQVINYGHRFQYGLGFYLREIKSYLKEGDMVVIVAEYQMMLKDYFADNELNTVIWEGLNEEKIPIPDVLKALPNSYGYLQLRYRNRHVKDKPLLSPNRKNGFNQFGDLTCHWDWQKRKIGRYPVPQPVRFDTRTLKSLKDFRIFCESRKIQLINLPPMYAQSSFLLDKDLITHVAGYWKELGLEYQSPPSNYTISDSFFFDSPYHLRREGVTIKTQLIINDLKTTVEKSAKFSK